MGADPSEADRARDRAMASDGQHYVDASREMPVEGMAMQQQSVPMTYTQPAQHPETFMRGASPGGGYPGMPGPQLQLEMQPEAMPQLQSLRALQQVERPNQLPFEQPGIQGVWQNIDFNKHEFPLARIRMIMKRNPAEKWVAAEALQVVSKACEMFILDLTRRAWGETERRNLRTLQRSHIVDAARKKDYDFLAHILPSK